MKDAIAIIPARSGSKRLQDKNIRILAGKPLLAHSIESAKKSNVFDKVFVATDSPLYAELAKEYGAEVPSLRTAEISDDKSSDIEWVNWAISTWSLTEYEYLAILRPTSPLRNSKSIEEAMSLLRQREDADSIRAVTKSSLHPGKMWVINRDIMYPLLPFVENDVPWHSTQTAKLPAVYFQNASLEIARIKSVQKYNSISGEVIIPYISTGYSGLDINEQVDLDFIEYLIDSNVVSLL